MYLLLGVVIAAEWMCDGKQLVTASWDHTSKLWDAEHGKCVSTLSGKNVNGPTVWIVKYCSDCFVLQAMMRN